MNRTDTAGAQGAGIKNTNKWGTRQLVTMALLCAIGVLLSFIEFPLIPGVTWLKYDASAMPAMVCGFAFGAGGGLAVGIAGAIIHGILMADFSGAVMNILVVIGFVVPASLVYQHGRTLPRAIIGLIASVVCAVSDIVFNTPHSRIRFPNIKKPIRETERGATIPATTVIRTGNKILVIFETFFCSYGMRIKRSFFVVIRRITAGCTIGTSAIYE